MRIGKSSKCYFIALCTNHYEIGSIKGLSGMHRIDESYEYEKEEVQDAVDITAGVQ